MLSFISWQQYLLTAGLAGSLYYLVVILCYYRNDLASFVNKERTSSGESLVGPVQTDFRNIRKEGPGDIQSDPSADQQPNVN